MKIIIDGYNLLHCFYTGFSAQDPHAIDALLEGLRKYKRLKRADITVYFDGTKGAHLSDEKYTEKGIKVVFTGQGRTADDAICNRVSKDETGTVVVSSDRAVKACVEKGGAICVNSEYFSERLQAAIINEMKGLEEEDIYKDKPSKGPSKRKKKKDRKRDKILPDL